MTDKAYRHEPVGYAVHRLKHFSVADIEAAIGKALSEIVGAELHVSVSDAQFAPDLIPPKASTFTIRVHDPIGD
jgi:hypothetical protein